VRRDALYGFEVQRSRLGTGFEVIRHRPRVWTLEDDGEEPIMDSHDAIFFAANSSEANAKAREDWVSAMKGWQVFERGPAPFLKLWEAPLATP